MRYREGFCLYVRHQSMMMGMKKATSGVLLLQLDAVTSDVRAAMTTGTVATDARRRKR